MKFDKNLASIHAYLCADGYVIRNPETQKQKYYMIGFRNTNFVLLKDFQERFEKVFGMRPYLIEGQRCRIGSREIYEKLTKEFGSFYSWEWTMPKLNENLTRIWLRAYFDCEGWVTCKSHQNRMIGIDCVNEKGIKQIKEALEKLDIMAKIKKRNTRNIFSLSIFGRDNLTKFKEKIGFLHPEKREKLEKCINDFIIYDWVFPSSRDERIKFILELLKNKSRINKSNGVIRIISNKEKNLIKLQEELNRFLNLESKVNKRVNGLGTIYYELNINKQEDVKRLIEKNLINENAKKKWLMLKK